MQLFTDLPPLEFFEQSYRVAESFGRWLDVTDIQTIRKTAVPPSEITEGMTTEEKRKAVEDFQERTRAQAKKNLMRMLEVSLREHPAETLELMSLICCTEPEEASNHRAIEFVGLIMKALSDKEAMSFFVSLVRLGQMAIPEQ